MRVLIEAAGSPVSNYIIQNIKSAGHEVVASDISDFNHASVLADSFIIFPRVTDPDLWQKVEKQLIDNQIDIVIPSLDEMMISWAKRKRYLKEKYNISVIVSSEEAIKIFQSKWDTYLFFKENNIPTPETAYEKQTYPLVKPIWGRGSVGVEIPKHDIDMKTMISQEICEGTEYTIDVLFDSNSKPIYIIPRERLNIKDGKSTKGITKELPGIDDYINTISSKLNLYGPINFQCFEHNGKYKFIECNPRIAGGMALGIAATENWFKLLIDNISDPQNTIQKNVDIKYGLKMVRYYAECFIP